MKELRVAQHGVGGGEPAARVSVDAHPVQIDEGVAGGELPDDRDVIGDAVVDEVAVVVVVEGLGAVRRPQVVDLHHHEAQLRQREVLAAALELPVPDVAPLGSGIDMRDDRVLGVLVEIGREIEDAEEIGDAVACLRREHFAGDEADFLDPGDVRELEFAHDVAIRGGPQNGDRLFLNT